MQFVVTPTHLLLLLVSLNAGILSVLLWGVGRKHPPCIWLGWLVFSLGINLLNYQVFGRLYFYVPTYTLPRIPTIFALGPLVYQYVHALYFTDSLKKGKWLFIPAGLDLLYVLSKALWIYFFDLGNREAYFDGEIYPEVQVEFLIHDGLAILYTAWMIYRAFQLVKKNGHKVQTGQGTIHLNPSWLTWFLILMGVHASVWAGFHMVEIYLFPELLYAQVYFPLHLGLAFLILLVGFRGLMHPQKLGGTLEKAKYQSSGLSEVHLKDLGDVLRQKMEGEKMYLNPELRLNDLSKATGLAPHIISQVLSTELGTHFQDFVNTYRINHVKQVLSAADDGQLSILGIGLDAGFNSKNTFYRVFKTSTGLTPTAYRKHVQNLALDNKSHPAK